MLFALSLSSPALLRFLAPVLCWSDLTNPKTRVAQVLHEHAQLNGRAAVAAYRRLAPRQFCHDALNALPDEYCKALLLLEQTMRRKTHTLTGHEVCAVLWAAAMQVAGDFKTRAASEMIGLVDSLTAQAKQIPLEPSEVGTILWSLASMCMRPSDSLLTSLTEATMFAEDQLAAPVIANYLWAFAKLRKFDLWIAPRLMALLSERALDCAARDQHLAVQDAVSIIWAFARLNTRPPGLTGDCALMLVVKHLAGDGPGSLPASHPSTSISP